MAFPPRELFTALSYQPHERKSQPDNVAQLVSRGHSTLLVTKTCQIVTLVTRLFYISPQTLNVARPEHQVVHSPTKISHLLAVHESFPPMYGGQVIPWTQRKGQAENLVGGCLRPIGQGESSSDQQGKVPNLAHSYPSTPVPNLIVPSGVFDLPVTPPLP